MAYSSDLTSVLSKVTSEWLDRTDPHRAQAVAAIAVSTGQSPERVSEGLDAAFRELTESRLREAAATIPRPARSFPARRVLHIAAGNVFTAWLHGAVLTLFAGDNCWIKPSTHEPVFPALWKQSLERADAETAFRVTVVAWSASLLNDVDVVVAYGSDETLQALKAQSGRKLFIGYGHKASIGVIFQTALGAEAWASWRPLVTTDIEAFNLNGCLSPQVLYIEGSAESLLHLPISGRSPEYRSFRTLSDLQTEIETLEPVLSCIGVAGSDAQLVEIRQRVHDRVRVCFLGEMQRPSLLWKNGGISLIQELLKR